MRISRITKAQKGPPSTDATKIVTRESPLVTKENSRKNHSSTNMKKDIRYNTVIADITTRRCACAPFLDTCFSLEGLYSQTASYTHSTNTLFPHIPLCRSLYVIFSIYPCHGRAHIPIKKFNAMEELRLALMVDICLERDGRSSTGTDIVESLQCCLFQYTTHVLYKPWKLDRRGVLYFLPLVPQETPEMRFIINRLGKPVIIWLNILCIISAKWDHHMIDISGILTDTRRTQYLTYLSSQKG